MRRYILPALIAVMCWSGTSAQDGILSSRSLTIEGNYNPDMSEQGKIMPVPEREQAVRQVANVSYRTESNPYKGYERAPLVVFGQQTDDPEKPAYNGLVRLGLGLRTLTEGLADFRWDITDKDRLTLWGIMDGWSTKPDDDWKSRMFNADMKLGYAHSFDSLAVGADFGYGHSGFNYRDGKNMTQSILDASNLNNRVNRSDLSFWVKGDMNNVRWSLSAGLEWYNRKGLRINGNTASNKETLQHLDVVVETPISGSIGGVEYHQKSALYKWTGMDGSRYKNFTTMNLSPYWNKTWDKFDTRLGFNINLNTRSESKIIFNPMITVSYLAGERIRILAGLTGGPVENDMRTLEKISPYWSEAGHIRDGFTISDLWTGMSFSQATWYTLSAKVGYRHTIDELFQVVDDNVIVTSLLKQQDSDVLYVNVDADMQFQDRGLLRLDMTYSNYMGTYSDGKLALKPIFDASLFGKVNIIRGIDAMLTYKTQAFYKTGGKALPMVHDLALTLDYDIMPDLSLYLTGNRLAGGDWYYYAGYRSIRPSVMVGATYRF